MTSEGWIDPKSHYHAVGSVSGGRMTGATVTDNNGTTIDRNATFESESAFCAWATRRAGMS